MRNLQLPSRECARENLKKALKSRRFKGEIRGYTATDSEINSILELYDNYDGDLGAPSDALKGIGLRPELLNALNDAYDLTQKTRKLKSIRSLIFSDINLCPVCGIDPVVELDHYLPISKFKPLAIYTRNLVPMCHTCNHTKLAGFGENSEEDLRFLHAYFDELPDVQFIQANINIQGEALVVHFDVATGAGLPAGFADRLNNQITELHLNARYRSEINIYISGYAITLHTHFRAKGKGEVVKFLELQARYETAEFYRNHWRPVLLKALSQHDDFCDGGFASVFPVPAHILADMD